MSDMRTLPPARRNGRLKRRPDRPSPSSTSSTIAGVSRQCRASAPTSRYGRHLLRDDDPYAVALDEDDVPSIVRARIVTGAR